MSKASEQLLAGPRGRRLCWELAERGEPDPREWAWVTKWDPSPEHVRIALQELRRLDAPALAADVGAVMLALLEAVDSAWYWQSPHEIDGLLARPEFRAALTPLAEALTQAPALAWWRRPLAADHQRYVQFLADRSDDPPSLHGAAAALARWRSDALDTEAGYRRSLRFRRPPTSGEWWSTPIVSPLVHTSGPAPGLDALGLEAVEDGFGQEWARLWPLAVEDEARIYELAGPEDWVRLVRTYPLELTASKGPDWQTITGTSGRWFVPDWPDVAADHDGVHLSVTGYLATNGRALEVGDGHTVLAGWDPDETWWLNDVLHQDGDPRLWSRDAQDRFTWALQSGQDGTGVRSPTAPEEPADVRRKRWPWSW